MSHRIVKCRSWGKTPPETLLTVGDPAELLASSVPLFFFFFLTAEIQEEGGSKALPRGQAGRPGSGYLSLSPFPVCKIGLMTELKEVMVCKVPSAGRSLTDDKKSIKTPEGEA